MTRPKTLTRRYLLAGTAVAAAAATQLGKTASAQQVVGRTTAPDLSGRSVLITGTSSGFGRSCSGSD